MANLIVRLIMLYLRLILWLLGLTKTFNTLFDKLLRSCIKSSRNKTAKTLLNQRLIKVYDDFGTLLHDAAESGNHAIVSELIELGADVDRREPAGKTPLMLAVEHKRAKTVRVLLEANADVDRIVNAEGKTALQMAYESALFNQEIVEAFHARVKNDTPSVDQLIDKLLKAGCTMYHAVYFDDVGILERMLSRGSDVNFANAEGQTALHAAAALREVNLTMWLTDNGADVNALDEQGNGPLFYAAVAGSKRALRHLLELGAEPNTEDRRLGLTPLSAATLSYAIASTLGAAARKYVECIELLAQRGAYVPRKTMIFGLSIFDVALQNDDFQVAKVLAGHLAVLERLGTGDEPESVMVCNAEKHREALENVKWHYEMCRRVLGFTVFEEMTLFDLLVESESRMKLLVRKEAFASKVEKFCSGFRLKKSYAYYYKTLMEAISAANRLIELESKAITVICDMIDGNYNRCYIVARKVVDYLDKRDLVLLSRK